MCPGPASSPWARPGSARIGLYPGQSDLGFTFIRALEWAGLAWDIRTPEAMAGRFDKLSPARAV